MDSVVRVDDYLIGIDSFELLAINGPCISCGPASGRANLLNSFRLKAS